MIAFVSYVWIVLSSLGWARHPLTLRQSEISLKKMKNFISCQIKWSNRHHQRQPLIWQLDRKCWLPLSNKSHRDGLSIFGWVGSFAILVCSALLRLRLCQTSDRQLILRCCQTPYILWANRQVTSDCDEELLSSERPRIGQCEFDPNFGPNRKDLTRNISDRIEFGSRPLGSHRIFGFFFQSKNPIRYKNAIRSDAIWCKQGANRA